MFKNMAKLFFLQIIISFTLGLSAFAAQVEEVKSKETFDQFLLRTIDSQKIRYKNNIDGYRQDLIKWNPHIKDWSNLPEGSKIFIEYPYPEYVPNSEYLNAPIGKMHLKEDNQKFSLFTFYTTSIGSYIENTNEQIIKSGQNFPFTLGVSGLLTNEEKIHFVTSGLYWAKPSSGNINGNSFSSTSVINIPGELGFNLYYQYFLRNHSMNFLSGIDFENLNTFNTDKMILGEAVSNISHKIYYATLGSAITHYVDNFAFKTQLSISSTLSSQASGQQSLSGRKYLLYFSLRPEGKFSYNLLLKRHELKGATDLTINRYGISIGYQIF